MLGKKNYLGNKNLLISYSYDKLQIMSEGTNNNDTNAKIDSLAGSVKDLSCSVEDLAGMMIRGFDHVEERFKGVEQKMAEFKTELKQDIAELDTKLSKKIDQLDFKVEEVRDTILSVEEGEILPLEKRVHTLEKTSHSHT